MIDEFRALHAGAVLVLPNAWDVASARLIEQAGARAVATTSAGVAWSLGVARRRPALPRRGRRPRRPRRRRRRRAGHRRHRVRLRRHAGRGRRHRPRGGRRGRRRASTSRTARYPGLRAGRRAGRAHRGRPRGPRRCSSTPASTATCSASATRPRGWPTRWPAPAAFVDAGADGVFVPGVVDPEIIAAWPPGYRVPLNVMAGPGAPTVRGARGARRGAGQRRLGHRAGRVRRWPTRCAREMLIGGTYDAQATDLDFGT